MERKCVCHQVYEKCDKGLELVYVPFLVSVTEGTESDVLQDIIGVFSPSGGRQFEIHVCNLCTNHPAFPFLFHGINNAYFVRSSICLKKIATKTTAQSFQGFG
jgi:hypothetical protein